MGYENPFGEMLAMAVGMNNIDALNAMRSPKVNEQDLQAQEEEPF